ncbi:hypothetical protein CHARACLAT_012600 [Characodon lateralis]|uniref:Uncharacterized protein n=1 Tax=Characodon lateralis TaxID=208331 RepID=A0ABU7CX08_9TELE|nr:hypothetical protein [Characodon lateralis]
MIKGLAIATSPSVSHSPALRQPSVCDEAGNGVRRLRCAVTYPLRDGHSWRQQPRLDLYRWPPQSRPRLTTVWRVFTSIRNLRFFYVTSEHDEAESA